MEFLAVFLPGVPTRRSLRAGRWHLHDASRDAQLAATTALSARTQLAVAAVAMVGLLLLLTRSASASVQSAAASLRQQMLAAQVRLQALEAQSASAQHALQTERATRHRAQVAAAAQQHRGPRPKA